MPRFFINEDNITAEGIVITGDDARHISRSLRMREGEKLTACSRDGVEYHCEISAFSGESVSLRIISREICTSEPPYRARIYQALARGEHFDTAVQKSVEFGAAEIIPVVTSRVNVKLSPADGEKKRIRWQRIAEEAAKQCGRGIVPAVSPILTLKEALNSARGSVFFCYEEEKTLRLRRAVEGARDREEFSVFIGPEGGFSPEEAELARLSGAVSVSLGKRILRTESAAPFVLACLSFALED